jgi:hypothetical protein
MVKKTVFMFILLTLSIMFLALPVGSVLTVDPSIVGTGTTDTAIYFPFQHKGFYAAGRFWVFYSDGSNMVYRTSTDGSTWSAATTIRAAAYGSTFSVWFDGTYLHYAYAGGYITLDNSIVASGTSIYYRRGTPNTDGTITWSAPEQTVSTTYNRVFHPMVSVDSNGYVWIGYMDIDSGNYAHPYVIKSGNKDGTWGTTPTGFPYLLSSTSWTMATVSVIPLTSGKMLALYIVTSGSAPYGGIRARRWDGSAWGTEVTTTSAAYKMAYYSAVAQGDDVHLVFLKNTGYDIIYTKYSYASNSFSAETTLQVGATSSSAPVISINPSTNDLCVFWAGYPTSNHIYYRKYTVSTGQWETAVDWIAETETLTGNDRLTCFYMAYSNSNYMGLVYMTKTASPYNVKFAFLYGPSAILVSPSSGAVFPTAVNCTFVWSFTNIYNASDYQTAFRLQLDDDPDFWTPNIDTGKVANTATNTTIMLPSTSGYYYWRVMVWDSQDFPSDWTAGRLIVVGFKYVLNGAYYENGTKTSFAVTVTAYFEQLQADQFSLNGTVTKLYDKKPTVFVFNFGAASRSWYVRDNSENITVFAPYDTVSLYTFTIQDYAGIIGNNTYFQVDSFINNAFGTMTVTRVKATGQVTVPLQVGRSYLLRLVGDGWTYDFKLFIASALTSETLTTKPVFEDRVKLTYKYILADASRDSSSITVKYQDNLKSTLWVYLKIRLTNGTVVYASNVTGLNLVQWVYPLSDNNTLGYWVELAINHASLGSLSYTKALPPAAGRTSPWDLSPLGSFPIPANQVFGVFIVLVFAGLFSTLNAEYGIVLVCMVAGILWLLGWLNIPAAILAFAMSLAVLYALGRRNIQT